MTQDAIIEGTIWLAKCEEVCAAKDAELAAQRQAELDAIQ